MSTDARRRLVLAGLGFWGADWAQVVRQSSTWELAAIVDSDVSAREAAAVRLAMEGRAFASVAEAAGTVEADAALVVVPPHVHAPVALEALRAGLHCLIEKPLATTVSDARMVVEEGERRGLTVMVSQQYRHRPAVQTIRSLVDERTIGDIGAVSVRFYGLPSDSAISLQTDQPLLLDMAIHHFDLIRGMLRLEPTAVLATSYNPPGSRFITGGAASALIETQGGAVVTYLGNWAARERLTRWEGVWDVLAEKGSLHWADDAITLRTGPAPFMAKVRRRLLREPWRGDRITPVRMSVVDRSRSLSELARAIDGEGAPETSGRDNIRSLAVTLAAVESARTGSRVAITDVTV